MKLSPDQLRAVADADAAAERACMPTYTTLLRAVELINKALQHGVGMSDVRKVIAATGVYQIFDEPPVQE